MTIVNGGANTKALSKLKGAVAGFLCDGFRRINTAVEIEFIAGNQRVEVDNQQRIVFVGFAHSAEIVLSPFAAQLFGAERKETNSRLGFYAAQTLGKLQHHANARRIVIYALQR